MSLYQAFCILWYLDRGDLDAARLCSALPPAAFAFGDAIMRSAFLAGAAMAMKD